MNSRENPALESRPIREWNECRGGRREVPAIVGITPNPREPRNRGETACDGPVELVVNGTHEA